MIATPVAVPPPVALAAAPARLVAARVVARGDPRREHRECSTRRARVTRGALAWQRGAARGGTASGATRLALRLAHPFPDPGPHRGRGRAAGRRAAGGASRRPRDAAPALGRPPGPTRDLGRAPRRSRGRPAGTRPRCAAARARLRSRRAATVTGVRCASASSTAVISTSGSAATACDCRCGGRAVWSPGRRRSLAGCSPARVESWSPRCAAGCTAATCSRCGSFVLAQASPAVRRLYRLLL